MLELCLGSYLVIAIPVIAFFWSALVVAKRADHIRYGVPFWSAVIAAKRADRILYGVEEAYPFQLEEEKVHFTKPIPSVDV